MKRCAFQTIRPVVSRKKRCFSAHFGPGEAVPPPRVSPFSKVKRSMLPGDGRTGESRRVATMLHLPDQSALGEGWGFGGGERPLRASQGGSSPPTIQPLAPAATEWRPQAVPVATKKAAGIDSRDKGFLSPLVYSRPFLARHGRAQASSLPGGRKGP